MCERAEGMEAKVEAAEVEIEVGQAPEQEEAWAMEARVEAEVSALREVEEEEAWAWTHDGARKEPRPSAAPRRHLRTEQRSRLQRGKREKTQRKIHAKPRRGKKESSGARLRSLTRRRERDSALLSMPFVGNGDNDDSGSDGEARLREIARSLNQDLSSRTSVQVSKKNMEFFPMPFFYRGPRRFEAEPCRPLLELKMMSLSGSLREKRGWQRKMLDPRIRENWRREAKAQGATPDMFEWVMQQLRFLGKLGLGDIRMSPVDGVFESDACVDDALREGLIFRTSCLEDVPEELKDYHPGSRDQVVNLVHPSLFCLVNGVSRVLDSAVDRSQWHRMMGSGAPVEFAAMYDDPCSWSSRFQWLPSDVNVDEHGNATFASYVNNLHPDDHKELYQVLEGVLSKFIPMFELTLTNCHRAWPQQVVVKLPHLDENTKVAPEVPAQFLKPQPVPAAGVVNLRGRCLQVIVKLASIELTPTSPEYTGGSWHVEGMANESIVATGIYYYSSENIGESRLHFRTAVAQPDYVHEDKTVFEVYGDDIWALNQRLGSALCVPGRCICFPNNFQHRVAPFRLQDPSKHGHRKILVFFLVDPTQQVLSTARVPPQQREWFDRQLRADVEDLFQKSPALLSAVLDKVRGYLDPLMGLDQSKAYRAELMEERSNDDGSRERFEQEFNFCEH